MKCLILLFLAVLLHIPGENIKANSSHSYKRNGLLKLNICCIKIPMIDEIRHRFISLIIRRLSHIAKSTAQKLISFRGL